LIARIEDIAPENKVDTIAKDVLDNPKQTEI